MGGPLITLTTDFGGGSPYVAQMKAVILSLNPLAHVVDVTHEITPQDVRRATLVLDDVCHHFPDETIHIAVVDPGVGTERAIVYAQLGSHRFIAPDNGLLTLPARRMPPRQIVQLANREFWRSQISSTFHGRDIMAPVAAHVSLGVEAERLGQPQSQLMMLELPAPRTEPGRVIGEVIFIDSFGNLITNIDADLLPQPASHAATHVGCLDWRIEGIVATYGERDPGDPVALLGSNGRLEIAVVNGDAAKQLRIGIGDQVVAEHG